MTPTPWRARPLLRPSRFLVVGDWRNGRSATSARGGLSDDGQWHAEMTASRGCSLRRAVVSGPLQIIPFSRLPHTIGQDGDSLLGALSPRAFLISLGAPSAFRGKARGAVLGASAFPR